MPASEFGTGIHWQVGQATSIINVDFIMNASPGTQHQGIFMENGSGGFMSDLTFTGYVFRPCSCRNSSIDIRQGSLRDVGIESAVHDSQREDQQRRISNLPIVELVRRC
jgi:hypothetical protein